MAILRRVKAAVTWLGSTLSPRQRRLRATERHFENVFTIMAPDRREAIIQRYMRRHGVSRIQAMELAIKDRRKLLHRGGA